MATPTEGRSPAVLPSVLIVDDQPFFTTMLRTVLEQQGFRVFVANSGPDGLKLAKKNLPDIIVLDIEMPGVILTGTSDPKLNEKAFKAGADITAMKSLSAERLVNMIRLALNKGKPAAGV